VRPLAAVQSEFSLFSRDVLDNGVLDTLRQLDIGLVAFSPLGRGFLTGRITTVDDLEPGDARRTLPRFQPEAIAANLRVVGQVQRIAAAKDATPARVALAWVQAQGAVAIPGTRHRSRLDENAAAVDLVLTGDDLAALRRAVTETGVPGERTLGQVWPGCTRDQVSEGFSSTSRSWVRAVMPSLGNTLCRWAPTVRCDR
jgi:aryl-alcohol dehydrogenase-like predicted oxidoreductase